MGIFCANAVTGLPNGSPELRLPASSIAGTSGATVLQADLAFSEEAIPAYTTSIWLTIKGKKYENTVQDRIK
jgi:hypothetical protein